MRTAVALFALLAPSLAAAAPRLELVVGNEALVPAHAPRNLEAFLRRLEVVGGWPQGTFHGKAFPRPREALEHIRKNKSAFAILPPHQLVQGRQDLSFEVLGRAIGMEGPRPAYWGVVRNEPRPYTHIEDHPGLRLVLTEAYDLQWLRVLLEGAVPNPEQHFRLMEVTTN